MLEISVCIATWERKNYLKEIIKKLENQTLDRERYEIIVCDSFSLDGTKEMMNKLVKKYNNLKYVNTDKNILATKRNIGIKESNSEIIIFMDDDVFPEENFIEAHLKAHINTRNKIFCGNIKFPIEWVCKSNYYRYREFCHRNKINSELEFNRIVVMNMSFKKKEFLEKVGYVSEKFIGYGGEDTELGYRIKKSRIKLMYLDTAIIYHHEKSESIIEFGKKILKSGKDGAKTLLEIEPEILKKTNLKYFIKNIKLSKVDTIKSYIINIIVNKTFGILIGRILLRTDSYKKLYCPLLYKYYLAEKFKEGVLSQTEKKLSIEDVKNGWYD